MLKVLEEVFWAGYIIVLTMFAMFVWIVTIMEFVESPIVKVPLLLLVVFAMPMTLSVLENRQKRLLDEALSDQLEKDTKA